MTVTAKQADRFIYLASGSPRRRMLLEQLGLSFEIIVTDIDESIASDEAPADYVQRMASEKAAAALARLPDTTVPVLAADTTVVCDHQILGKPVNEANAQRMLKGLSGRDHEVLTAVMVSDGRRQRAVISRTVVTFRELSEAEIAAYWAAGEPQGKAGSYAIQGLGAMFVKQIQGSYTGVVGLPLFETAQLLHDFGYRLL